MRILLLLLLSINLYSQRAVVRGKAILSDTYVKSQSLRVDTLHSTYYLKSRALRVDTATIDTKLTIPSLVSTSYVKAVSLRADSINWTNSTSGAPYRITNSSTGSGLSFNNTSTGRAILFNVPNGTGLNFVQSTDGKSISIANTSTQSAIKITNATSTGKAIEIDHINDNNAISIDNKSGYSAFDIENSSEANGIDIHNNLSGTGISIENDTTGIGYYVSNFYEGKGFVGINASTATEPLMKLYNNSVSNALNIENSGTGTAMVIDLQGDTNTDDVFKYSYKNVEKFRIDSNGVTHNRPPHAFLSFADSSESITMASNANWYNVNNGANGIFTWEENDYIDSLRRDTIQLMYNGHYQFHYHVVFIGSSGTYYNMRLYNVTKTKEIPIKTSTTGQGVGNRVSIGNTAYCTFCQKNDKVVLQMQCESNSNTVTLIDGSILIIQTHGE